ncbi:MAG TPA: hypothetical protein EYN71_02125 [Flavobacteriales bacterium]|nr:hypothetical protein [Flavobacteriales bacterium]
MKRIVIMTLLIALAHPGFTQDYIDLANINYSISPSIGDSNAMTEKKGVHFQVPIVLKNKDVIVTGFGGAVTNIHNSYKGVSYHQNLHHLMVLLGYKKQINEKLSLLALTLNQINADPKSVSLKNYQPGFYTLFTIAKSNTLKYKLGALYKYEFSGPFIIPLFGVDWQVNDKLQIFGTLPITANVIYKPGEKLGYGLSFKGSIATYALESGGTDTYLQENNNEIHALLDYYVAENIVLQAKVGYQTDNKYSRYSPDDKVDANMGPVVLGDERIPISRIYGDGLAYKLSFIYRFSLNQD